MWTYTPSPVDSFEEYALFDLLRVVFWDHSFPGEHHTRFRNVTHPSLLLPPSRLLAATIGVAAGLPGAIAASGGAQQGNRRHQV